MNHKILGAIILIMASITTFTGCEQPTVVKDMVDQKIPQPPVAEQKQITPEPRPQSNLPAREPADTRTLSWYTVRGKDHQVPSIDHSIGFDLKQYQAYYIGSKDGKIFLTFDEGYENGYTAKILDILKANQVPAAFFVTEPYLRSNPELVKRMIAEGHIVANHSHSHPSMPSLCSSPEKFNAELTTTAQCYKEITGKEMPLFFRPPRGEYSEKSLQMTEALGYKTIFWSFAYEDWLVDRQPPPEAAYEKIIGNTHNGEIMLLHAVSATNTAILDRVLKEIKKQGYRFSPLTELSVQ